MKCPLCLSLANTLFYEHKEQAYFQCESCNSIFRDPRQWVSLEREKARYELHENSVDHEGYRLFVTPLLEYVYSMIPPTAKGLDFGCGHYPTLSHILENNDYETPKRWDPFFHPNLKALDTTYDYILCVEVMEHFHRPNQEFQRLSDLLKPGGRLLCMTHLAPTKKEFSSWYYKNDITHVFFYSKASLQFIKNEFGFSSVSVYDRLIIFQK